MRFVQLDLKDFKLVKESGLSKISVTFNEDVQITIGANGSGKSSFLSQLSPFPAAKPLYENGGQRIQIIENDGIYYRLQSDYDKSSGKHSFYEGDDEENLNVGKLVDAQVDLIKEHLGITPLVDDLIMNRYEFPKWTSAKRKEFLMAINPDDIGFILQDQKRISSEIRACKNNVTHLQTRKIKLEQELLSEEAVLELENEKKQIESNLSFFQNQIMKVDIALGVIEQNSSHDVKFNPKTISSELLKIRRSMYVFKDVSRDDVDRDIHINNLRATLQSLMHRNEEAQNKWLQDSEQLQALEHQYSEIHQDGDIKEIENSISRLEMDRDKLIISKPSFEIPSCDLQDLYNELGDISEVISDFDKCTVPLYSSNKRSIRDRILNRAKYKASSSDSTLSDLRTRLEDLSKRSTISPSDIPNAPCAKDACPLYSHFKMNYDQIESQRVEISKRISRITKFQKRNNILISGLVDYFNNSKPYHDKVQWLVNKANNNPILHSILKNLDILHTLKHSSSRIIRLLKDEYDKIEQWHRYRKVVSDLETSYALRSRKMGSQDHDTVRLVVDIENLKVSLSNLRTEIEDNTENIRRTKKTILNIEQFNGIKNTVLDIQNQYGLYSQQLANHHERSKLLLLKRGIEDLRSQAFLRMSDVERLLRSQSGLRERYEEEVLKELTRIEGELSDLLQIERALIAIPKEITIDFVNSVFKKANLIIGSIWTVPFKIELLSYTDDLNYSFYVSGANESLREMDKCSAGQMEMLSLAINLAIRLTLKHVNLPLCLDETGKTFDEKHKQNLTVFLRRLLDDKNISQLFYVSHHAATHESFSASETLVLMEDNVLLPEVYNKHCTMS